MYLLTIPEIIFCVETEKFNELFLFDVRLKYCWSTEISFIINI